MRKKTLNRSEAVQRLSDEDFHLLWRDAKEQVAGKLQGLTFGAGISSFLICLITMLIISGGRVLFSAGIAALFVLFSVPYPFLGFLDIRRLFSSLRVNYHIYEAAERLAAESRQAQPEDDQQKEKS